MTEGAVPAPAGAKVQAGTWLRRQSSALFLIGAVILGLLLSPLFTSLDGLDVAIDGRISLLDVVWLIVALVLCALMLRARSSISRDLGEATRQWLASMQDADDPSPPNRDAAADAPRLGAALVRGILNLAVLFVAQGMLRTPAVSLASEYAPRAWVDGGWVILVFLIALIMLFGLHRVGKPLAEHVVWLALDQLVPTAGFAGRQLPATPSPRTKAAPAASAGRRKAEATRPAGAPAEAPAPTPAGSAEATRLAPSDSVEATVPAPADSAEATRLAPLEAGATAFEATVLAPAAARLPTDDEATIAEAPTVSEEATVLAPAPMPPASDEATVVAPIPAASQPAVPPRSPQPPPAEHTLVVESAPSASPADTDRTIIPAPDAEERTLVVDADVDAERPADAPADTPPSSTPRSRSSVEKTSTGPGDANPAGES